jgi:hypothetical protein
MISDQNIDPWLEVTVAEPTAADVDRPSCRAWTEVFNRNDGSFIVRYKLYLACPRLRIAISANGRLVAEKLITEQSWPDTCNCPASSLQVLLWRRK